VITPGNATTHGDVMIPARNGAAKWSEAIDECDIYDERGHLVGYTTLSLTDQQLARLNQPDDQHSTY